MKPTFGLCLILASLALAGYADACSPADWLDGVVAGFGSVCLFVLGGWWLTEP